jgi:hypothetical protein
MQTGRKTRMLGFAGIVMGMGMTGVQGALNQLSPAENAAGFELLFDGKTIDKSKLGLSSGWIVNDSAMRGGNGGDLCTAKKYKDFELRVDVRVGKADQNSGIFTRAPRMVSGSYNDGAPEYGIQGEPHTCDYPCHTGDDYDMQYATSYPQKTGTEYNPMILSFNGPFVEFWVRGIKVNEYEIGSAQWKTNKANGKWANQANYGTALEGFICIQDHGGSLTTSTWFRNYKVREFSGNKTVPTPAIQFSDSTGATSMVTLEVGMVGAELRYTTNGSAPTSTSTLYSTPFSVSKGAEVKVQAFRAKFTASAVASQRLGGTTGVVFREGRGKIVFDGLAFSVLEAGAHTIWVRDLQGKVLLEKRGVGKRDYRFQELRGVRGVNLISIQTATTRWQGKVFIN